VQAKAYREDRPIPKAELNKFLSESNTKKFAQRLLISTTTSGLHQLAQRAVEAQEKPVSVRDLTDLRATDAYLDWPESLADLRPSPPPEPVTPHDYQLEAIRDVVTGFRSTDRGQLIMACGTGKTLTSLFVMEKLQAERVLVLVPSLSLLKQTMQTWIVNRRNIFDSRPVCSDATVSRDEDAIVAHTSYLGVPVNTDPEDIAQFLRLRGPRVVFATYQSSPNVAAAFALGRVPAFDLVVADEAHRCAGPVLSDFATVLDASRIKARRRLFMTATPRYFTGRVLKAAQDAEYEIASMDDEEKFGKVFHRLSFGEAIKRDLLTDYQVSIVGVDDDTYREWAEDGILVRIDGHEITDAATLAGQIGLIKAMRKYDLRRTISFHSRVKRARDFAAALPEVVAWMPAKQRPKGKAWCAYTSGEMNAGSRGRLIQQLGAIGAGGYGLLTNARCLAEGVDVPTLDGVAFIDPRRSEVDIVQAVGRAIRKSDDKKIGTVVVPVFVDSEADPEVALNSSVFRPIWDVVRALRAHDEELGRQLDELRRELGRKGGRARLPLKIHADVPVKVGEAFARAFEVRLIEETTPRWEFWFGLLERFVDEHSHACVDQSYTVEGYRLGVWVTAQRAKRNAGTLDTEFERRLESMPGWTWNPRADKWEESFTRLLAYVEQYGHAAVPSTYKCGRHAVGTWVVTQRHRRLKGTLDDDRQRRLEALPGWTWDPFASKWDEGFALLLAYIGQTGHAIVPGSFKVGGDGYPLGAWVSQQRVDRNKGNLGADREGRLQALPSWTWDPFSDRWEEGLSHLSVHVEQHGHARPAHNDEASGYRLGAWVKQQRSDRAKGKLNEDRERRLEALSGWAWDAQAAKWEEGFGRLLLYVEHEGHARVPVAYDNIDGFRLGWWVRKQRVSFTKGDLNEDRICRLEDLPGWTWRVF
jgi:superfamily II DNA or RNA helicase